MKKKTGIFQILLSLSIVCFLAGLTLGGVYKLTKDKIEKQQAEEEIRALKEILGSVKISKKKYLKTKDLKIEYWEAYKNGEIYAYAIKGKNHGYSSDIVFIVAVDKNGKILGLKILSQNETPGLGTRITEVASREYLFGSSKKSSKTEKPWFQKQFEGLNALKEIIIKKSKEWQNMNENEKEKLKKENAITALTGATISSRAVSTGIEKYVKYFFENKEELQNCSSKTGTIKKR